MEKRITVNQFRFANRKMPADDPQPDRGVRYLTQQEHWLGWLGNYNTSGAYSRKPGMNRDAKFAYNQVVCPNLLLYLFKAINIEPDLILSAENTY
jgi:hypothetical protein